MEEEKVREESVSFKIFQCRICILLNQLRHCIQINIERKLQFSTNGWNTMKNICVVNWCTIPTVSSRNTSRDKDISSATLLRSYSYTFVLKRWQCSTERGIRLWFHLSSISQFRFNAWHIAIKAPLKGVPSSSTTRWQRPNFIRTCCIK